MDTVKVRQKAVCKTGFTLIETVIVLVLLTVIFSLVGRKMFSTGSRIKDSFNFFSVLNRRLYTSAKLHGKVYRMVIKVDKKHSEEIWVERKLKTPRPSSSSDVKDKTEKGNMFQKDPSFLEDPRKITPLLSISSVESPYWKEEKTEGLVYFYYYPKGPGPEAAIHFKRQERSGEWTLYFPPVKRELRLIKGNRALQDIKKGF